MAEKSHCISAIFAAFSMNKPQFEEKYHAFDLYHQIELKKRLRWSQRHQRWWRMFFLYVLRSVSEHLSANFVLLLWKLFHVLGFSEREHHQRKEDTVAMKMTSKLKKSSEKFFLEQFQRVFLYSGLFICWKLSSSLKNGSIQLWFEKIAEKHNSIEKKSGSQIWSCLKFRIA